MTPEQRDAALKRSITDRFRKPLRDRLQQAESELRAVRWEMRQLAREFTERVTILDKHAGDLAANISFMLAEVRQSDDTTIVIALPKDKPHG